MTFKVKPTTALLIILVGLGILLVAGFQMYVMILYGMENTITSYSAQDWGYMVVISTIILVGLYLFVLGFKSKKKR